MQHMMHCVKQVVELSTQAEDKAVDRSVRMKEKPSKTTESVEEEASDGSDAQETTYISETDLDITEVETVANTRSLECQGPGGQRSEPVQGHSGVMDVELEAEKKREHLHMPAGTAEEDDALRLVREIFFT